MYWTQPLNVWPSRKALKGLLKNIYLMLELLHHKRNRVLTTAVDGRVFQKVFTTVTSDKKVKRRYYFC